MILGINAYHAEASAVVVVNGSLIAAAEEERFRRIKHWAGFPEEAVRTCLKMARASAQDIDYFAISRDPQANVLRKALFALGHRPSPGLAMDRVKNLKRVRRVAQRLAETLELDPQHVQERMRWVEHHPAHLASAFFVSPFEEAAVCAMDGFGDFVSTSSAIGRDRSLRVLKKIFFPHSLGMVYLAITQYLGFQKYGDEYKVMGLAAYGQPEYAGALRRLIHLKAEGDFDLDLSYFRHHSEGVSMTWEEGEPTMGPVYAKKLEKLLGPARKPEEPIESRHEAIAASLQAVFEEVALHILNDLYQKTGLTRLCLAGGCAMNSVMNGKIRECTPFKEVYIQPAAGDNGTALGAAFYVQHQVLRSPRRFVMNHACWGPEFEDGEVLDELRTRGEALKKSGCRIRPIEDEEGLCRETARALEQGKIVGWFQGRMEWGPRALGNRSILADPRRRDMREIINTRIKFREKFRPFAPSILEEALDDFFTGAVPDPFMIQVYPVRIDKRSVIPAVTHVDGSGRLQTVSRTSNPLFWRLMKKFEELTGVPVLLNTSFNENEPIVHKPAEALDCFFRTGMDVLVLGKSFVEKPRNGMG